MQTLLSKIDGNIGKIILFRILFNFLLIMPIATLFYLDRGLSMTEVFLILGVYSAVILTGEVPSGYLADKFGKKKVLITGSILFTLGLLMYIYAYTFYFFVIIQIVSGLGYSLVSGADSALLYDSLKVNNREDDYHKIESKSYSYSMYSFATSSIIGGILGSYSLVYPFYIQMVISLVMIVIVVSFTEVPTKFLEEKDSKNSSNDCPLSIRKVLYFFTHTQKGHFLVKLFLFTGLTFVAVRLTFWYQQPFWTELTIPIIYFGFILASLTYIRGFMSNYSVTIEQYFGPKYIYLFIILLIAIGYLGLAIFSRYIGVIVFFIAFEIVGGISTPIFKKYANQHTSSNIRATVLSIESMFSRVLFMLISPIFGYLLGILTFSQVFYISVGIYTVLLLFVYFLLQKDKHTV